MFFFSSSIYERNLHYFLVTYIILCFAAARIGKAILLDHGTGVVIGETAIIGDRVSILQVIERVAFFMCQEKREFRLSLR